MAKLTKNHKLALAKYDKDAAYALADAARIVKEIEKESSASFDKLVEERILELNSLKNPHEIIEKANEYENELISKRQEELAFTGYGIQQEFAKIRLLARKEINKRLKDMIARLSDLSNSRISKQESVFPFSSKLDFNVDAIVIDWDNFLKFLNTGFQVICEKFADNAHVFKKTKVFKEDDLIFVENLIDKFETKDFIYFFAKMKGLWEPHYYQMEKLEKVDILTEIKPIDEEIYLDKKQTYLVSLYEKDDILRKYILLMRSFPYSFILDIYDREIATGLSINEIRMKIIKFLKYLQFEDINEKGEISFSILKNRTENDIIKEYLDAVMKATTKDELQSMQNKYEILINFMDLNIPTINKINGVVDRKIENFSVENL